MNPQDEPAELPAFQSKPDDGQNQPAPSDDTNQAASQQPAVTDDQFTTEIPLPVEAEDTDLIEKEWVVRAKQIVEHTREDPYEQQRALSQMKADYLKKRYNKDIKASDG